MTAKTAGKILIVVTAPLWIAFGCLLAILYLAYRVVRGVFEWILE